MDIKTYCEFTTKLNTKDLKAIEYLERNIDKSETIIFATKIIVDNGPAIVVVIPNKIIYCSEIVIDYYEVSINNILSINKREYNYDNASLTINTVATSIYFFGKTKRIHDLNRAINVVRKGLFTPILPSEELQTGNEFIRAWKKTPKFLRYLLYFLYLLMLILLIYGKIIGKM